MYFDYKLTLVDNIYTDIHFNQQKMVEKLRRLGVRTIN